MTERKFLVYLLPALLLVFACVLVSGCTGADQAGNGQLSVSDGKTSQVAAQAGDKVSVYYKGTLDDGEIFDQSKEGIPLVFVLGSGRMIEGFDAAVFGMKPGESKTVTLTPDIAYGEYNEGLLFPANRSSFPEGEEPEVGQQFYISDNSGMQYPVTIVDITEDEIILDANHHLAGENLTFEITLESVER
ncbi:FKBP-type peptidyl-prolyl cis-trans isomerase [Methanoplanus endosymbiosus]|uniref:Peptidyl-prolyl cis-trans isomerase n=1 Tax=Methanoplanus endosymbiosus TaxID=33865 RepID=A0A9E7PN91_9EURY|nr:peptidylprolyl isomerase [Methanoplanus endosymbiosus]UUX92417.1 peptidylprolyl isomerase [Methanoplanus endosymbiosus]